MNCRRVSEVVYLYTDNEMGTELRVEVREHLVLCPRCARKAERAKRLAALVGRCARTSAPERLRERILTNLPHRQDQPNWE